MLLRCLCMLCGAYSLGLFAALPADELFTGLVLLIAICGRISKARHLAFLLAGFGVMWLAAAVAIDDRLDAATQGDTVSTAVRIVDFPRVANGSLRFIAEPLERPDLPARLRLAWYEPATLPGMGESWTLRVRLRRPHGYVNPGTFDYEGWLFRQGIGATGYVVDHPGNRRLDIAAGRVAEFRRAVVRRLTGTLPPDDATAVLLAVTVGARHGISRQNWDRYARTGTSHLMAISGLHIGLAAGGVFLLARALFALTCRRINARDPALMLAVAAGGIYATVSGFAVPAARALLMAVLAAVAALRRRRIRATTLLAIPCLAALVTNPLAIHAPGFKLSFAAVAIIFWSLQTHRPAPAGPASTLTAKASATLRRAGILQMALLAGLFPFTSLIFGRFAPLAPAVNLLVLPLFNFVTVPFALTGMFLDGPLAIAGDRLLLVAYHSVRAALGLVSLAADMPGAGADIVAPGGCAVLVAILPAVHVLMPPGWPGRRLAWIAMAAAVLYRPPAPPEGCLEYRVLDVGQGLAAVMQAGEHTVLYDTGPSFRGGGSTAEFVIVPFLESRGISRLDAVVVSHADQDHAGGLRYIANRFDIDKLFVGERIPEIGEAQRTCDTASAWTASGVRFRFLHPLPDAAWVGNNASCVLEVTAAGHKLLLTGDIETSVESMLLARRAIGPVDSLIVPHHGSSTSSSPDFVAAVRPHLAIVSAGYGNRWGFPKSEVVRRFRHVGSRMLQTATSGAIGQRFCRGDEDSRPAMERRDARRYWTAGTP